jgi:uncharacterized protein
MKIGIISDTHDNVANIIKAAGIFTQKKADFVIHCGDIVAPATVAYFKGLKMKFIMGNCDGDIETIRKKIGEIDGEYLGETGEVKAGSRLIGIYHGTDPARLEGMINSGRFDYVLTGHTHKSRDEKIGKTRVINPGAHYYGAENTVAILDTEKDTVEMVKVA